MDKDPPLDEKITKPQIIMIKRSKSELELWILYFVLVKILFSVLKILTDILNL